MKHLPKIVGVVSGVLYAAAANSYLLVERQPRHLWWVLATMLLILVAGGWLIPRACRPRIAVVQHGAVLLTAFLTATTLSVGMHTLLAFRMLWQAYIPYLWSILFCVVSLCVLFWVGILCVYLASLQMGVRQRIIGAVCGMIPVVNVIVLCRILRTVFKEISTETEREKQYQNRKEQQICKTRYPLLLVHGVFFRDSKYFNYWGRIPKELERHGAVIHYGNHGSAASVADSAEELAARIREIVEQTGCEKVNVIAHSKGGLDCRYAMAHLGVAPYVASLTTINTPHRGCLFADYLLTKVSEEIKNKIAETYNKTLRRLGEPEADFLAAVENLTAAYCVQFDEDTPPPTEVYCQSVGSLMANARGGRFPLNFSYHLVRLFDGANDGLVSETSFQWGDKYSLLAPTGREGISHGDMIDLNRRDVEGFDVREFYVELVHQLKEKEL